MAVSHNSRALTLYARADCPHDHRIRLVLTEKGVTGYTRVEVHDANEDLAAVNPYNSMPTLVDRELVLYDARTIIEYLDERYPHPPLMPADPVHRARYRMALSRFEADLYAPAERMGAVASGRREARAGMRDALARLASDLPPRKTLGEGYSLLDCTLAPILWRMEHYRLRLPGRQDQILREYATRLFRRPAFIESLTALEADMPQPVAG